MPNFTQPNDSAPAPVLPVRRSAPEAQPAPASAWADGVEVDLVIEQGGRTVAAVEVKASATVTAADFRGLRKLQAAVGSRFAAGVVLYDGEASVRFGDGLFAMPIRSLWEL